MSAPGIQEDVDRLVEAIIHLYQEARRARKEVARLHGLTGPQVSAIKLLEGHTDMSLSALSERMSARNSTLTGIVDRMERDGLVQRDRSSHDRRVVWIRLTPEGKRLAEEIPVTAIGIFESALCSLSVEERSELERLLRKLTDQLRDADVTEGRA